MGRPRADLAEETSPRDVLRHRAGGGLLEIFRDFAYQIA
jgi:hypothetical protein